MLRLSGDFALPHETHECVYLHGFASGPDSTKARFFREHLPELGLNVHVPDLNGNNFAELTLTGQLQIIEQEIQKIGRERNVLLMGSSMGGLLSVLAAPKYPNVRGLILLAPGFGLNKRWHELLGAEQLQQWCERGTIDVFHYRYNKQVQLKYAFIEDAEKYQTENLRVDVPTLVLHGVHDTIVPVSESERFAEANPHQAQLHVLDSDHGLTDVLPVMYSLLEQFLTAQFCCEQPVDLRHAEQNTRRD